MAEVRTAGIDRAIHLDAEEVKVITDDQARVLQASKSVDPEAALGESIGIEKIGAETAGCCSLSCRR